MNIVPASIENYCIEKSQTAGAILLQIEQYTRKNTGIPQMLCGPLVASFLQSMVLATRATTILELGTFTGYSAIAMAQVLPPGSKLDTIDMNQETSEKAREFFVNADLDEIITAHTGDAKQLLATMVHRKYDLIFIDADKTGYREYLEKGLRLLNNGGCIIVDNCLWSGRVLHDSGESETNAIKEFNNYVKSRKDLVKTLVPIRDGMYLISKSPE